MFGVEADIGTGDVSDSRGGVSSDLNVMGSVRARAGALVSPGFLVYATGGFAWADYDLAAAGNTTSETFTGYQIGAGTELMMSQNWGLRLEYLYTDLSEETVTTGAVTNTYDPDFHTLRAGLTFKF